MELIFNFLSCLFNDVVSVDNKMIIEHETVGGMRIGK
jgi:hypothetical protein